MTLFNVLSLYYNKWSAVLLSSAHYSFEILCEHATSVGTPTPAQSPTRSPLIKKCSDEEEEDDASGGQLGVGEYTLQH